MACVGLDNEGPLPRDVHTRTFHRGSVGGQSGEIMGILAIVGTAAAGAGAFVAAPLVSMARRGTIEQQTVASWRDEAATVDVVRRARRRTALVAAIPAPRGGAHEHRRSPLAS
ncbi:MAG: hypothetical protein AVDCRST_MAG54-2675 [uncultured Actinomycetospora sp.]|uniref:Uncharacterized protein n=1 Tax=uncultured Actinomycetospora sp. TaxID=1135996 RepID=A0A6J4IXQ6_9PSEU|nr:MAG: hypothetical protein AVDCRST_MAG54-2675 [uncultured Actinomycetospora sp.]